MKKIKNSRMWKGFFINMLGVIIAIILTFGVNSLWEKHEENKRTKEMLILVRNELVANKEYFKNHERELMKDRYVYKKILDSNSNFAEIDEDTLKVYLSQAISWSDFQLTTFAWQIFQNSEMIQKITDKELVIRLTACYFLIEKGREVMMNEYWDKKKNTKTFELEPVPFFETLLKNKEAVYFYTIWSMDLNNNTFWNIFPLVYAFIDYTVMLLDKHGDYRYDMDEKDNEFESFLNAKIDSFINARIQE